MFIIIYSIFLFSFSCFIYTANEPKDDQTSLNTSSSNDGMYDTIEITEDNNHHIVNVSTYDPELKPTNLDLTSEDYPNNQNDDHDHEDVVNKLSNTDSINSDSSVYSSTVSHTDDTTSDHHYHHHKLLRDRSKKHSGRTTTAKNIGNHNDNYKNKFCGKIDPIKVLLKPFCPGECCRSLFSRTITIMVVYFSSKEASCVELQNIRVG